LLNPWESIIDHDVVKVYLWEESTTTNMNYYIVSPNPSYFRGKTYNH